MVSLAIWLEPDISVASMGTWPIPDIYVASLAIWLPDISATKFHGIRRAASGLGIPSIPRYNEERVNKGGI